MKILILGADGYLGWPTTLHFADQGHEVVAVDNYWKRDHELYSSLISNISLFDRKEMINFKEEFCDIAASYDSLNEIIFEKNPDVIIHYAEQPSAPYSMLSHETAQYTVHNNIMGTLNLIHAINEVNPNIHLIKFGSMGEYGTPNIDIEEGFLKVKYNGREERFLYPKTPGSLYHTTKVYDTDLLWFYTKQWGLRVTDIMQGVIYGVITPEIEKYKMPTNFYYDEIFGTVINRFLVQAIIGHPLTIYGNGSQQRTFLNLKDVIQCLDLVIKHPPCVGEMEIINQFSEVYSIHNLVKVIKHAAHYFDLDIKTENKENLRQEKSVHHFWPRKNRLDDWGLKPHYLDTDAIKEMFEILFPYKDQINEDIIYKGIKWKK